jgi:succinate dehydrogenase / fumarate reductase cytochrome b subunit
VHGMSLYNKQVNVKIAETYKDLYKITIAFFKDKDYGLLYTVLYVISMAVLGFHLYHGFGSAFQSLGANNRKYNSLIKGFGKTFAIVVPLLFAVIPLYIHFILKV